MTAPAVLFLYGNDSRAKAAQWLRTAPRGSRVAFYPPTRTIDQNAKLHADCTDVAQQVEWAGRKRSVEAWKDIFTAALLSATHDLDIVPGINGGFVLLGLHTSGLSVAQCADLITLIQAFGAEHGVVFQEDEPDSSETPRLAHAVQG